MKTNAECMEEFREMAESFLHSDPVRHIAFLDHWEKKDFRSAYLVWHEFDEQHRNVLSPAQERKDEEFYWRYIA